MKKKLLAIFICLVMVAGLLPTVAFAAENYKSPKYGIRVVGDTDLTIKLSGTNSITLDNGGGIFADGSSDNYNIIGDGKLTINVKWDALYTLNGNSAYPKEQSLI